MTTWRLDIEQVRDLVFNGYSRYGAATAVAESHGEGEAYLDALLDALNGVELENEDLGDD